MNPTVHSQREVFKRDSLFWWRPGRVYIPSNHFTGMTVGAINEGGAGNFAIGEKWEGTGVGAPISKEVSTFGINATLMESGADEVNHLMQLPYDLDIRYPVEVRVHWTSGSATTADTIDWIVRYLKVVPDVTTLASAATALDKTIAQDTVIGAYTHQVTAWGAILPAVTAIADNVEMIEWEVEMDTFAVGLTEDKFFLGLEVAYTPKRLYYGDGMPVKAKRPVSMLSSKYTV